MKPVASLLAFIICSAAQAQPTPATYAQGLTAPIGIEIDNQGRLWVAQQGTGSNDSKIVVVTTDGQVHPFLEGLPSGTNSTGETTGGNHPYFDGQGNLVIVQGEGTHALSASLLLVDTTGFVPGNPPLGTGDIHTVYDIGSFSLSQGSSQTNPYTLSRGPNGDQFIVDAAANAIVRRDSTTGTLSAFATFADVANTTGIGPPNVDAVPTGIGFANDRFYVGSLTGFPFANGAASVYEVDLNGATSVFKSGLTTIVDVDVDPIDGELVVLQHAAFRAPPPFVPASGGVFKLKRDGSVDTLAFGLNRPSGLRFGPSGDLFVSTLTDGQILMVMSTATDVEELPGSPDGRMGQLTNVQTFPNPFTSETRVRYSLPAAGRVVIAVVNILGQRVGEVHDAFQDAGVHEVTWDGRDDRGARLPNGVYLYTISWRGERVTKAAVLRR